MKFKDILSFDPQLITDGEICFDTPEKFSIYFKNFKRIKEKHNKILVCFTAAVSERSTKKGPFFSGVKVSDKAEIPLISLSDYVVTKNQSLALAWYTGDSTYCHFQKEIAGLLEKIASFFKVELILLGGSGGGFASLAIASFLTCKSHIITMNPQIIIENYFSKAVNNYLDYCFPNDQDLLASKNFISLFSKYNILNNLANTEFNTNINIYYLQNKNDNHHIDKHFSKFIDSKDLYPIGDNSFLSNNIGFYLGEWGASHSPPSVNIILSLLQLICKDNGILMVLRALENGLYGYNVNSSNLLFFTKYDYRLKLKLIRNKNNISIEFIIFYRGRKIEIPEYVLFSVYILDENSNINLRLPYQRCYSNLTVEHSNIRLKVFAKDLFGNKITALSEII